MLATKILCRLKQNGCTIKREADKEKLVLQPRELLLKNIYKILHNMSDEAWGTFFSGIRFTVLLTGN